ncbi:hypothetical protein LOTGIDRAFT_171555 [Lottia gigantea]|uniref:Uncharacterized protein n=1 Tax=Lottia gigantea TaxID=225164 RepID=V4B700_LOTGI|nr:hypothetical protein LOTGIDRAFT_171555 [Lottia gigantea]ESP03321.1 hypothetical protein LOTGIDRAFT_171555 [Lottia gigantea]
MDKASEARYRRRMNFKLILIQFICLVIIGLVKSAVWIDDDEAFSQDQTKPAEQHADKRGSALDCQCCLHSFNSNCCMMCYGRRGKRGENSLAVTNFVNSACSCCAFSRSYTSGCCATCRRFR